MLGSDRAAVLEDEVAHAVLAPLRLDVSRRRRGRSGRRRSRRCRARRSRAPGRRGPRRAGPSGPWRPRRWRSTRPCPPSATAARPRCSARMKLPPKRISNWKTCVSSCAMSFCSFSSGTSTGSTIRLRVGRAKAPMPSGMKLPSGVGLLELRVGRVIDDVDRLRDLEVQRARDLVVRALGVGRDLLQRHLLAVVEVDREVRRLVGLPGELVVDDLVLAEVVVVGRRRSGRRRAPRPRRSGRGRRSRIFFMRGSGASR